MAKGEKARGPGQRCRPNLQPLHDHVVPDAPKPSKPPLKKGSLVRVNRESYARSAEAAASDPQGPDYIFEGPGDVLAVKGPYAQLRWRRPVPDVWLPVNVLEAYPG